MSTPRYLPVLTVLTCVYLAFELAFNARLLDIAGRNASEQAIHNIEVWGRTISGLAVALGIVGIRLMPDAEERKWSIGKQVIVFGLVTGMTVALVFRGEQALVDELAAMSSGQARGIAARLGLFSHAILTNGTQLDGIDLDQRRLSSPEGKSFIALLPVLAFATPNLDLKTHDATLRAVRDNVRDRMGSPEKYYNDVFRPSEDRTRQSYNEYVNASNRLRDALSRFPKRQREAWAAYNDGIVRQLGPKAELRPGLTLDEFVVQPDVQRKWRGDLGIDKPGILTIGEQLPDFSALSYQPTFDRNVREKMGDYEAQDIALADGGPQSEFGRTAMRSLLVPPIALCFSLMGGVFHIGKLSLCLLGFLPGSRKLKRRAITMVLGVAVLTVFAFPNEVSSSRVFRYFQQQTSAKLGIVPERFLTWVVQAQPVAYPINEAIRRALPGNVTYGYDPSVKDQPSQDLANTKVQTAQGRN